MATHPKKPEDSIHLRILCLFEGSATGRFPVIVLGVVALFAMALWRL